MTQQAIRQEEYPFTPEWAIFFVLFKTDRMNPTHIMEGNLLYSVHRLNCQSHPKTPLQTDPKQFF